MNPGSLAPNIQASCQEHGTGFMGQGDVDDCTLVSVLVVTHILMYVFIHLYVYVGGHMSHAMHGEVRGHLEGFFGGFFHWDVGIGFNL